MKEVLEESSLRLETRVFAGSREVCDCMNLRQQVA